MQYSFCVRNCYIIKYFIVSVHRENRSVHKLELVDPRHNTPTGVTHEWRKVNDLHKYMN